MGRRWAIGDRLEVELRMLTPSRAGDILIHENALLKSVQRDSEAAHDQMEAARERAEDLRASAQRIEARIADGSLDKDAPEVEIIRKKVLEAVESGRDLRLKSSGVVASGMDARRGGVIHGCLRDPRPVRTRPNAEGKEIEIPVEPGVDTLTWLEEEHDLEEPHIEALYRLCREHLIACHQPALSVDMAEVNEILGNGPAAGVGSTDSPPHTTSSTEPAPTNA